MKEATGEMNMTVVTIIAIGAIIAFFWFMWPQIRQTINKQWTGIKEDSGHDEKLDGAATEGYIVLPDYITIR